MILYKGEQSETGKARLDNVAFHKSYRIREVIENSGNHVLFIPPYSPDFNPIEEVFSKLKFYIRRHVHPFNLKQNIEQLISTFCNETMDFNNYYEHAFD